MENTYLEKIAANAYKRYLASKGQNVEGISNASLLAAAPASKNKGTFQSISRKADKMGVMPSSVKPSLSSRIGKLAGNGPKLSPGAQVKLEGMRTTGTTLNQALHQHIAAKNVAQAAAPKGLIGKAMGLAKKHPVLAAGSALAAGAAAGAVMGRRPEPNYPQY